MRAPFLQAAALASATLAVLSCAVCLKPTADLLASASGADPHGDGARARAALALHLPTLLSLASPSPQQPPSGVIPSVALRRQALALATNLCLFPATAALAARDLDALNHAKALIMQLVVEARQLACGAAARHGKPVAAAVEAVEVRLLEPEHDALAAQLAAPAAALLANYLRQLPTATLAAARPAAAPAAAGHEREAAGGAQGAEAGPQSRSGSSGGGDDEGAEGKPGPCADGASGGVLGKQGERQQGQASPATQEAQEAAAIAHRTAELASAAVRRLLPPLDTAPHAGTHAPRQDARARRTALLPPHLSVARLQTAQQVLALLSQSARVAAAVAAAGGGGSGPARAPAGVPEAAACAARLVVDVAPALVEQHVLGTEGRAAAAAMQGCLTAALACLWTLVAAGQAAPEPLVRALLPALPLCLVGPQPAPGAAASEGVEGAAGELPAEVRVSVLALLSLVLQVRG